MKTPRDILFERHRAAEAKLDTIRESALASLTTETASRHQARARGSNSEAWGFFETLREVFSFRPQTWVGLAAVWVLIFVFKFSTHDASPVAANKTVIAPGVLAQVRQQKLFFSELIGGIEPRAENPPKVRLPRSRSALSLKTLMG